MSKQRLHLCLGPAAILFAACVFLIGAAPADRSDGSPRYCVIQSDGLHLIVADNQTQRLYFYAAEPDGRVGDDLELRGHFELSEVGQSKLTPTVAGKE